MLLRNAKRYVGDFYREYVGVNRACCVVVVTWNNQSALIKTWCKLCYWPMLYITLTTQRVTNMCHYVMVLFEGYGFMSEGRCVFCAMNLVGCRKHFTSHNLIEMSSSLYVSIICKFTEPIQMLPIQKDFSRDGTR